VFARCADESKYPQLIHCGPEMFAIIGIVIVFGCVAGGYLMEHGNMRVLLQPAELLIIVGAAAGTVLIANPLHVLKHIVGGVADVFKGSKFTRARYLNSLKLAYQLLNKARRQGLMSLETDIEDPGQSQIFSQDPDFVKSSHVRNFFCDSMRMAISGVEAFDLDQLIELDLEVLHHDATQPVASLTTVADSLPGLGIVAAVLGVVITMQALGGPPEEIGRKVAAALVGTFLGILLCYGLIGPLASNMAKLADDERAYLNVLRVVIISFLKGTAPILAIEAARRATPGHVRPTFQELEEACRGAASAAAPPAAEGEAPPPEAEAASTGG
jgi:chemotaxis protein MotA